MNRKEINQALAKALAYQEHTIKQRHAHHNALATLSTDPKAEGVKLWRKLRRLETLASRASTAQCNGEACEGQPYRGEAQWEGFQQTIMTKVAEVFGRLPIGFFYNTDPRGYALKIDPQDGDVPKGMHKDLGGDGILAPEIN